jgi:hypothetical protein
MPYIIRPPRLRSTIAACAAVLAVGAVPAQAETLEKNTCEAPVLSQLLLSSGDANLYFMPPGVYVNNFAGTGWSLSGGASIQKVTLANGSLGGVLDLPSGAQAVSPPICVTNEYPSARFLEKQAKGTEGVNFYVSYLTQKGWTAKSGGKVKGKSNSWTLSEPVPMQPSKTGGWQIAEIVLNGAGSSNDFQLYNLYVDPYVRR